MIIPIISFVTLILSVFYVAVLWVLKRGWYALPLQQKVTDRDVKTKVSVLIAARNEERNIAKTIEAILAQNYPKDLLEVIIVDDHSTDSTSEIISSYQAHGVKLIQLNEEKVLNSYKKKAIGEAISKACGELIVATDADCLMGPNWLRTIVNFYEKGSYKLISSPVVYHQEKSYFERLQTLEFLYLIGLGASSIGIKKPSTCNGANLAYRKDVFHELGGFQGIDELASGDDELFLHKVAREYHDAIGFCKSKEAIVYTEAKENLKEFLRQRRRWASKSTKYKDKRIVALGVSIWLFNFFILLSAVLACYYPTFLSVFLVAFLLKMGSEFFFLIPIAGFAKQRSLLVHLPLLSALHIFYMIYIGIAGNTGRYHWKGRLVK